MKTHSLKAQLHGIDGAWTTYVIPTAVSHGLPCKLRRAAPGAKIQIDFCPGTDLQSLYGWKRQKPWAGTDATVAVEVALHSILNARKAEKDAIDRGREIVADGKHTLDQIWHYYSRSKLERQNKSYRSQIEAVVARYRAVWGGEQIVEDIDVDHLDQYAHLRITGRVEVVKDGKRRKHHPVGLNTVRTDWQVLNAIFNWAKSKKVGGERLLRENPLDTLPTPEKVMRTMAAADEERFQAMLAVANKVDPSGRFRLILCIARYTGHRLSHILKLNVSDLLLTEPAIEAAIGVAKNGNLEPSFARHWAEHGAILWANPKKREVGIRVLPIGPRLRKEIDTYLVKQGRVGATCLFFKESDLDARLYKDLPLKWWLEAERVAGLQRIGARYHSLRRLWRSERKGYNVKDVYFMGGWAISGLVRAMGAAEGEYNQVDPHDLLELAEVAPRTARKRAA
jgi:hypothetical protein